MKNNQISIEDFRKELLNDFWKFVKFMNIKRNGNTIVPSTDQTLLYYNICKSLNDPSKNFLLLLPRRHLKTLITSLYITWYILKYPDNSVFLITATLKKGKELLASIRKFFLYHENFRNIFSDSLLSRNSNNMTTLTLKNRGSFAKESNINIQSIYMEVQSYRSDLIVLEDIVGDNFMTSPANRQMIRDRIQSLEPLMEKNAHQFVTGTRYTVDDPYFSIKIENEKSNDWCVFEYGVFDNVYNDKEKVLCSYVMSFNEIMKKKDKHTLSYFSAQYLNKPISEAYATFDINSYSTFTDTDTYTKMTDIYIAVDLSDSIGKDKNAICVCGTDNYKYYLLDCYGDNMITVTDLYYKIVEMCERYDNKISKIYVELNRNGRTALRDVFTGLKKKNRHDFMNIIGVTSSGQKQIRIGELEPLLRANKMLLPNDGIISKGSHLFDFKDEMTHYNPVIIKNLPVDLLDACSICINQLRVRNERLFSNSLNYNYVSKKINSNRKLY